PRKRPRVSPMEASVPSTTATTLESAATIALVSSAPRRSAFVRNWWYQCSVNPLSGNDGSCESLNENTSRIRIGAYRNTTTSTKNARMIRSPFLESAASISSHPSRGGLPHLKEPCEHRGQGGDHREQEEGEHRARLPVREARAEQVDDLVAVHV